MNLIIFLLFILVIILIINYLNQKDFIAPTFLMLISFLMALVLILLNKENWMIHINGNFILCILVAVVSWILGSVIIRLKNRNFKSRIHRPYQNKANIKYIEKYPKSIMHFLSLGLTVIFFLIMLSSVDRSGGLTSTLRNLYQQKAVSTSGNFLLHQVDKVIITIAYISVYQLLNSIFIIKSSWKNKLLYILPVIYALLCILIASDRNVLIRFVIYCLCLWILFYKNRTNYSRSASNKKILKFTIIVGVLFVLVFYGMGKMKQYTSNLERMLGIYGGSGLYNFNLYLDKFDGNYTYGKSTFNALLGVFAHFGFISEQGLIEPNGFIIFLSDNGYVYSSNIYSSLQPFYEDFGVFGIIVFCFILGMFFETLYQRTEKKRYGFSWVFYATFIYPTIYMSIAEQFFARLHLGLIYELFWLGLFYVVLYDKKKISHSEFRLFNTTSLKTQK